MCISVCVRCILTYLLEGYHVAEVLEADGRDGLVELLAEGADEVAGAAAAGVLVGALKRGVCVSVCVCVSTVKGRGRV